MLWLSGHTFKYSYCTKSKQRLLVPSSPLQTQQRLGYNKVLLFGGSRQCEHIAISLRFYEDNNRFRPCEELLSTMVYELVHNDIIEHTPEFWEIFNQYTKVKVLCVYLTVHLRPGARPGEPMMAFFRTGDGRGHEGGGAWALHILMPGDAFPFLVALPFLCSPVRPASPWWSVGPGIPAAWHV